ncbi:protein spinster isoform X1 [Rhagoletis pomonella]|uniref:protein spinster isoform X1 n=1 Tax=Rhagoletis pomonella TaxID=28610 RepID=UPI00177C7E47|nr:protein spinster isoform X1 [Rhagoletis pomonella]
MICAPVFGYLGDRYSRRWIMAIGVLLWSTTTLLGSFMGSFGGFITFRALVGIGEASYSTIAPTIISDLFVHDLRSKMLALFYFAIPVGSGFGYIVGSETARLANDWRWALRVTPMLGIFAVALILLTKEPVRGESEGSHNLEPTSYTEDIKDLVKNHSFMLSTAGFTCVAFVTGALAWWGPKFIYLGIKMQPGNEELSLNDVSLRFGIITMVAGLIGVPLGPVLSRAVASYKNNADPLVCAYGIFFSSLFLAAAMLLVTKYVIASYVLMFVGQLCLNLNWALVADILLYVVVPTRRSTAEAFQILISHALGDAGSPYFVGLLSEGIKRHMRTTTAQTSEYSLGFPSLSLTAETRSDNITDSLTSLNSTAAVATTNLLAQATENVAELVTNATDFLQQNVSDLVAEATNMLHANSNHLNGTQQLLPQAGMLDLDLQDTDITKFKALQYSLFSTSFIEVLGAVFFFLTAIYILKDKRRAARATLVNELNDVSNTACKDKEFEPEDCEYIVLCTDIKHNQCV